MGTMYRVRQVGVGAAFDAFCDEAALRHHWPHQAEAALGDTKPAAPTLFRANVAAYECIPADVAKTFCQYCVRKGFPGMWTSGGGYCDLRMN